ncbi:class I SAM-dependent methyltransferase [Mycobacterium asiaticum]|uniref:SAM-dependent methyltransferase n=1 Tax=Mycobacterium asiaticum TaxID=1790 RepID=A0A1A3N752_MYCAS|nr:class I SAM-dependent methyltransferase [Mycobacterium asiaticum]OBK16884.1 SAM-dependent methyltransferase [Mycobacterium asiaticum]
MTDAMQAEFDTVAEWTARVAADLGPDYHIPAGCRGSGSPAALDWLIEHMQLQPGSSFLDCGAGVGGPAAYAAQSRELRPVLLEPEAGACRAARRLFGYPVLCASGSQLPLADRTFDAAWSLGVLCTTPDQHELMEELRRTVRPGGYIGLLAFVAHDEIPGDQLEGNHFPSPDNLAELIRRSSLRAEEWLRTADLPAIPETWNERVDTVTQALTDRYGHTEAWQLAERQSGRIGQLLEDGILTGELLVLRHA